MLQEVQLAQRSVARAVSLLAEAERVGLLGATQLRALHQFLRVCRRGLRWALHDAHADTEAAVRITTIVLCAAVRGPDVWSTRQRTILRRTLLYR